MMAMVEAERPLYASVGYDEARDYLYIITVHWLYPGQGKLQILKLERRGTHAFHPRIQKGTVRYLQR